MRAETKLELQRLLSGLCDQTLSDAEFNRLEHLLSDRECRRHYLEYMELHSALLIGMRRNQFFPASVVRSPASPAPIAPHGMLAPRFYIGRTLRYVAVAAGALAASFLFQVYAPPPMPAPTNQDAPQAGRPVQRGGRGNQNHADMTFAFLRTAVNCVWESPTRFVQAGERLGAGEYRLAKGVAAIDFDSGSALVVEGPASIHLDSSTAATIRAGKAVFRADESAAPFVLRTPSSTLAESETEFAIAVNPEAEEVHVFEGKVERIPASVQNAKPEELKAGDARRYEGPTNSASKPAAYDSKSFVRVTSTAPDAVPAREAGLLAYEGFDYRPWQSVGKANGGFGWTGPWKTGFVRPPQEQNRSSKLEFNAKESLTRTDASAAAIGGSFSYAGYAKAWRRLAQPVRLDTDGVYYLSFMLRRDNSMPHPIDAAALVFWTDEDYQQKKTENYQKRLNIGVKRSNLAASLQRMSAQEPITMEDGVAYLLVAKIVANRVKNDRVYARLYGPKDVVEAAEPATWPLRSMSFQSDLVFDWVQLHVNSKTRHTIDEIRLGTTWSSVTSAWTPAN